MFKFIICIPVILFAFGMLMGQENVEPNREKISPTAGSSIAVVSRTPDAYLSVAKLRDKLDGKHKQLRSLRAEILATNIIPTDESSVLTVVAAKGRCRMVLRKHQRGDEEDPQEHVSIYDGKSFNVYYPYNRIYEVSQRFACAPYTDKVRSDTFFEILGWWPPDDPSSPPKLEGRSFFLKDLLAEPKCRVEPQQELVNGHVCHVVEIPGLDRLWIDPQICVLVRRERLMGDPPSKLMTYEFEDFREVSPGLWLPYRVTRTLHSEGSRKTLHRILSCEVNEVTDSTFSHTLQPETIVCDRDTDTFYQVEGKYDMLGIILDRVLTRIGTPNHPIPYKTRIVQFLLCAVFGIGLYSLFLRFSTGTFRFLAVGTASFVIFSSPQTCQARSDELPSSKSGVRWQERASLLGHKDQVNAVAFSPDGKMLASGGEDSSVLLWDLTSVQRKLDLKGHKDPISCLAFSPDGKLLASGSSGFHPKLQRNTGQIIVWEIETGKQYRTFNLGDKGGPVSSVSFSPDGTLLVASGDSGRSPAPGTDEVFGLASVWDVNTEKERATFKNEHHRFGNSVVFLPVTSANFSPDGKTLLFAGSAQLILWDWVTSKNVLSLQQEASKKKTNNIEIFQFAVFHPGGKVLATVHSIAGVKVWDVSKQVQLREFPARAERYQLPSLAFVNDGKMLVTTESLTERVVEKKETFFQSSSEVCLWGTDNGELLLRLQSPTLVRSLASSRNGKLIAVGCQGKIRTEIPTRAFTAEDVAAGRGPKIIGDKAGIVRIWELLP